MSFSILGTGSALPACTKTNADLSLIIDTTEEWITTRTGIKERHILSDEPISDIAAAAATAAITDAGISPDDLDLIICATIRGDYISPSLACIIQKKIGADCPAFDVNAACPGFIYALDVAVGYFARKKFKKVLVVASEAMSRMIDWNDRATCVLFGDGAGAVVLAAGDDLLAIHTTATGDDKLIRIPHVSGNCPYGAQTDEKSFVHMEGQEVYKFAINSMCRDINIVMEEAMITEADIDYILPHQANVRIIEAAQNRLRIPKEKYLINICHCANTSAASIPIMMDEANRKGLFKQGDILALCSFGGGLTTGACLIRWQK